jgi:hypothetical protein
MFFFLFQYVHEEESGCDVALFLGQGDYLARAPKF